MVALLLNSYTQCKTYFPLISCLIDTCIGYYWSRESLVPDWPVIYIDINEWIRFLIKKHRPKLIFKPMKTQPNNSKRLSKTQLILEFHLWKFDKNTESNKNQTKTKLNLIQNQFYKHTFFNAKQMNQDNLNKIKAKN